ncbi:MAG: pseudouridine synthase [Bacteroidia bacterium]|jgi:23S rRNA pseudouridine2457 synthase|nr:pseudouridine synthase [Bacteroidia bacterium]
MAFHYILLHKPYGFLSQFTDEGQNPGLNQLLTLPPDVYPVGRLDSDSEGLLLLTNDKRLNQRLLDPENGHPRTYWAQVEGIITEEALQKLCTGVELRINGKSFRTLPAQARRIEPPSLPPRNPPIRVRQSVPDCWIELTLTEGKNRQVRRMTAAVGFPTLRLVRSKIGDVELGDLKAGESREVNGSLFR